MLDLANLPNPEDVPPEGDTDDEFLSGNNEAFASPMSGAPIQLEGDDYDQFFNDFHYELLLARGRNIREDDITRWRDYYHLRKPEVPYEGAPAHTLPIVRGKVRGFVSHAWKSMNRDPFYIMRTYSEKAGDARNSLETLMERELDRVNAQRQIKLSLKEAGITGTCFLGTSVVPDPNDDTQFIFPVKAYRLENFYVSPVGVEDLRDASTFVRTEMPQHVIDSFVERGFFDEAAAERLNNPNTHKPIALEEERDQEGRGVAFDTDNSTYEIYECYYRWQGTLYHVYYSELSNIILHLQESPYREAIGDMPPYQPVRLDPELNYVYGTGIAHATEAAQDITDFAYNAHQAQNQHAIAPIMFVKDDSEAYHVLAEQGAVPGGIYPTVGDPRAEVYPLQVPPAQLAPQEIGLAKQVADGATFFDNYFTGEPLQSVRSATEVSMVSNASTTLLSDYMDSIAYDLGKFAQLHWALIYEFKIKRDKIVDVAGGDGQYLVADEEIDEQEYTQRLIEFAMQRGMDPEMAQQMVMQYQAQRREYVPGANRDDFEWIVNGQQLVPDKLARAGQYERLMSMVPLLQMAAQFRPAWHLMKDYLETLDIHSWRKYLPPEPPAQEMDLDQMMQYAGMVQQMRQGGGS